MIYTHISRSSSIRLLSSSILFIQTIEFLRFVLQETVFPCDSVDIAHDNLHRSSIVPTDSGLCFLWIFNFLCIVGSVRNGTVALAFWGSCIFRIAQPTSVSRCIRFSSNMLSLLAVTIHPPTHHSVHLLSLFHDIFAEFQVSGTPPAKLEWKWVSYWVSQFSKCEDVRESRTWGSRVASSRPRSRHTRCGSDPQNDVCITVLLEQILWSFCFLSFLVRTERNRFNQFILRTCDSVAAGIITTLTSIYIYI